MSPTPSLYCKVPVSIDSPVVKTQVVAVPERTLLLEGRIPVLLRLWGPQVKLCDNVYESMGTHPMCLQCILKKNVFIL